MIRRREACAGALGAMAAPCAWPAPAFTNAGILLLQPEDVLRARVKDSHALARYIKDVQAAAAEALDAAFQRRPNGGFVVLALRPGGRSKVWLDLDAPMPEATQHALRAALQALPPPEVQDGVVVLALTASFWGGRPPTRPAPAPPEWRAHAARSERKLEVGELVEALWRD
jgi:hypothetical protein